MIVAKTYYYKLNTSKLLDRQKQSINCIICKEFEKTEEQKYLYSQIFKIQNGC